MDREIRIDMDFLSNHDGNCRTLSALRFNVCDDAAHPMAYLDLTMASRGCLVVNPNARNIVFRPIDRALYGSNGGRRCDLMLRTVDCSEFCFVELKDWKVSGWFVDGLEQLKNTLADFIASHPNVFQGAKFRSAYVVNMVHGFSRSHKEVMRNFVRKYHTILRTQQPVRFR